MLQMTTLLTAEDAGSKGAAGDPQVVGIFLSVQLVHVQAPQAQVSIGGPGHEHLAAGAEGAGDHGGVIHCSRSATQTTAAVSTSVRIPAGIIFADFVHRL